MIESEGDTVAAPAALSLNGFRHHIAPQALTPKQKSRIVAIAGKSPLYKSVMADFVSKIAAD